MYRMFDMFLFSFMYSLFKYKQWNSNNTSFGNKIQLLLADLRSLVNGNSLSLVSRGNFPFLSYISRLPNSLRISAAECRYHRHFPLSRSMFKIELQLHWLYLTVFKTYAVNFYIHWYPKVLPFCEITPSKSAGNYCQKLLENNKIHFCDAHESRCIQCENVHWWRT